MIIVKLIGGLGNQLFQYAAALNLANRRNTELKIDRGILGNETPIDVTPRELELDLFQTNLVFASQSEIDSFKQWSGNAYLRFLQRKYPIAFYRFLQLISRFAGRNSLPKMYIAESGFRFMKSYKHLPGNVYLEGFWQSEKYFCEIRDLLLKEFTPRDKMNDVNLEILNKINKVNSVSIHFRRGDFITNKNASNFHGALTLEYYKKAVTEISGQVSNPEFFIFSDDANWVKENFKIDYPINFVMHNTGRDSVYDMVLMSNCKHNVIANSSFSWWGAWMNKHESKIVIAPKHWFNDETIDTADLIPSDWLRI